MQMQRKQGIYEKYIKRVLDIICALLAIITFWWLYLIIAVFVRVKMGTPVIFRQLRPGMIDSKTGKERIFYMYKFRSMRVNSPDIRNDDGSTFNGENDSRVTKVGKVMRKTSIDEVPQILNVLKGDMSIIGPRPFVTTHYKGYEKLGDKERKRLEVRPGITGYSQAYYRNSIGKEEKIDNDCYYTENVSLILDIRIFVKTIKSVIRRENIYIESGEQRK